MDLANFTDVLGDPDEIGNSQPLSLSLTPQSTSCCAMGTTPFQRPVDLNSTYERPARHTGQQGEFRSVEEIDPKYRDVFSYPYFNLVQSRVIDDALYSDKSMVVCAPTGSGKTVVFEMAIVQLLMELDDKKYTGDFKIIYMAPVKALCSERLSDWYPKFTKLGLMCIEVTGDTNVDFSDLKPYRIIITTPEKWDMLTRRWRDHKSLVEVIKLFLIDEVHILNDDTRGPVLEAVVSRMKTIESSSQSAHRIEQLQKQYQANHDTEDTEITSANSLPVQIRFVAISATVSNPEDVAAWLGTREKPAKYHKYGDECRPVKLKRVVEGYPCAEGTSIFKFDIILNYKLWPVIQKYHDGKPTLIFCNTRKSVTMTAETLSRELTVGFTPEQQARLAAVASKIKTKKLQALILSGIGCHHAGLLFEERLVIEEAFRNRDLPILITTTTLAMGVNLPAHLVIIKNTQQYVNGGYQEYSISTVLQMVGRAGRPQFDTHATAVIMTRLQDKARYQALVGGDEPLQSYLHKRLAENLNSEAALGTVCDVAQCVQWLRSTFLSVRAAKDPKRYLGLPQNAQPALISKKIEELCVKAMNGLASSGLITMDEASCIESTEAGRLMSVFYLDLETMKHIMKIEGTETLDKLLWIVCESHELADMHLRVDERRILNALNRNNAAVTIRFPMKGKISTRQMKLNCIIQAILGCLPIPDPSLNQEAMKVMRIADRVCKCLVAYVTRPDVISNQPQYFTGILNAVTLGKCISSHLWENSPYVSRQLKGIGPTFSTLLATAGKVNFALLEESHPRDLERIMNRGAPAGNVLRKQVSLLPKYQLTATPIDEKRISIQLVLLNQHQLAENRDQLTAGDLHKCYVIIGDSENYLLLFTSFMDKDLINVYDGAITYEVTRKHNFEHKILIHCISSNWVGIDVQCDYLFKNIEPIFRGEEEIRPITQDTSRKTTKKQTSITDVYRERKRKNNDTDMTESKEKKKRDTALVEKFQLLKNSFEETSKELRKDLDKSAQMSNMIINEMVHPNKNSPNIAVHRKPSAITLTETDSKYMHPNPGSKNGVLDDLVYESRPTNWMNNENEYPLIDTDLDDEDNFVVDDRINSILNEIETEIQEKPKSHMHVQSSISTKPLAKNARDNSESNITKINSFPRFEAFSTINKILNEKKKRKHMSTKTNYSFMDTIEKNVALDHDISIPERDSGFSDTIKSQIEKFLQKTANTRQEDMTIKELISNTDATKNVDQSGEKANESGIIDEYSGSEQDVVLSSELPAVSVNVDHLDKTFQNKIDTRSEKIYQTNKEDENVTKEIPNDASITSININKIVENIENEYNIGKQLDNKLIEQSVRNRERKPVYYECDRNLENQALKKEHPKDEIQEKRKQDNIEKNSTPEDTQDEVIIHEENYKLINKTDHNIASLIDMTKDHDRHIENSLKILANNSLVPIMTSQHVLEKKHDDFKKPYLEEVYNAVRSNCLPFVNIDATKLYSNKDYWNTAANNTNQKLHEMTQCFPSNSKKNMSLCVTNVEDNCNENDTKNVSFTKTLPKSPRQIKSNAKFILNSNENNVENQTYKGDTEKENTDDYINKYSFSSTKIDVCTKNLPDHQIKIVRKLKLDLDVTEIISKVTNKTSNSEVDKYEGNKEIRNPLQDPYRASSDLTTNSENIINQGVKDTEKYINRCLIETNTSNLKSEIKYDIKDTDDKENLPQTKLVVRKVGSHLIAGPETNGTMPEIQNLDCNKLNRSENKEALTEPTSKEKGKLSKCDFESINNSNADRWKKEAEKYKNYLREISGSSAIISTEDTVMTETENNYAMLHYPNNNINVENVQQSNETKSNKILNILQKYSEVLRKNNTDNTSKFDQNLAKNDFKQDVTGQSIQKTKKAYKIRDIQNLHIPLPKYLITVEASRTQRPASNDILIKIKDMEQCDKKVTEKVLNTQENEEGSKNQATQHFEDDFPEDIPNSSVISSPQEEVAINYDLDLEQAMLNPRTLLEQCFSKDEISDDAIIPPPFGFGDDDDNVYSPVKYGVDLTSQKYLETEDFSSNYTHDKSIFEEDAHSALTPSVEIETWTLATENEDKNPMNRFNKQVHSQRNPSSSLEDEVDINYFKRQIHSQSDVNKSCTVMRKNLYLNKDLEAPLQHFELNSGHGKLRHFKFAHKRKLKM